MFHLEDLDINEIRDIQLLKYMQYQLRSKNNSAIEGTGRIIPYRGTLVHIQPLGKIHIRGLLRLGTNKIAGSKVETWVRVGTRATFEVKGEFSIYNQNDIRIFDGGKLTLGSGYINQGGVISCLKSIDIGHDVKIARNVFIYDNDFHKIKTIDNKVKNEAKPVIIGNHVWIGIKATILKGVTIGDGAIVAANSLVNRDVPARCMVAGNPARVIRENVIWE